MIDFRMIDQALKQLAWVKRMHDAEDRKWCSIRCGIKRESPKSVIS